MQVSAVAHRPRDADLRTLKSYQLLNDTQTSTDEICELRVTVNGRTRRPSKLSGKCTAVRRVDHPGVISRPRGPSVGELY